MDNLLDLGDMIDNQPAFFYHVASVSRSSCLVIFDIRRIRPFVTQHATQLLVQAMVITRITYCSVLTGAPMHVVKLFQVVQNVAARLVVNQPK